MIDDCLASGLNSAFSSSNTLQLMDIDVLVAMVMCALKACKGSEPARLHLSDGEVLSVSRKSFSFLVKVSICLEGL